MSSRLARRTRGLWFLLRRMPMLARSVGAGRLARIAFEHLRDGRGQQQLAIWCRDRIAFLERRSPAPYRRWIDRVEPKEDLRLDDSVPGPVTIAVGLRCVDDARATLESITHQTHPDCRTILAVPMSELERATAAAAPLAARVVTAPDASHDDDLTSVALAAAETPYALSLPSGAALAPNAVLALQQRAVECGADLVYSDEDQIENGVRCKPLFKPGRSPDLLAVWDYVGPVCLLRSEHSRASERPRRLYERVRDLFDSGAVVERVPRMLVHWHVDRNASPSASASASRNREAKARVASLRPTAGPTVSIIIATRDRLDLLKSCLASIDATTSGMSLEVIVVNNRSREPETLRWLAEVDRERADVTVLEADCDFNWSQLNNQGLEQSQGRVCLFLNNDVEAISRGWLEILAGHALREEIGAVGPLLLYPDETIQHAGLALGIGGLADHVYRGCPATELDGFAFTAPLLPRNVLAVTGACMAVERRKLDEVDGFDESLRICGDLGLCLRLHAAGYDNLYEPAARLYHLESATRRHGPLDPVERARAVELFRASGGQDPFYNPNLTLRSRFPTFRDEPAAGES